MTESDYFPSSRIKKSPTGRVPQWAIDEAMGRPVDVVPFRRATVDLLSAPAARPRRWPRSLLTGLALLALVGVAFKFHSPAVPPSLGRAAEGASSSYPPAGQGERSAPLGAPPAVAPLPEGSGYGFIGHQKDRVTPVTWSPCRAIHYVTRVAGQPAMGAELVRAAIAEVSRATGLQFVDDGVTEEGPSADRPMVQPDRYGNHWAPVLIAWASPAEVPDFGVDIVGEAGPQGVSTPSGDVTFVTGTVYLDPTKLAAIASTQGSAVAQVVVMHELGHLVGLAHTDDPNQVMFPRSSARATSYAGGDAAGLARLGSGSCQPDV